MLAFGNPWALWGLFLAAAPIVIHLLNRRRFKVLHWAAMEFLLASSRKNYRRMRIEQLLLLALRVLMIVVLVLLVAQPTVKRGALAAVAEKPRFVLLVMDTSMSMGYRDGAATCYDRGLAFAGELMASLREGDSWAVVNASSAGKLVAQEPSFDLEAARAAVAAERMPLSDGYCDIPRALEVAEEIATRAQCPTKEIYIVTDLQRVSWLGAAGSLARGDLERARRLAEMARVTLVDVGPESPANLAVASIAASGALTVAGSETVFRVDLVNYGTDTATDVRVHLLVDGFRQARSQPTSIAPGGTASCEFRHVFKTPGVHAVSAEIAGDDLPKDDRRVCVVDARESIRVLLVDGEPGTGSFSGETDYLRSSLRPGGSDGLSLFQPEVTVPAAISGSDLPRYDIVVLANVERLADDTLVSLHSYVRGGGALVVFLGEKTDAAFYNRALYRDGKGLLPCFLGDVVGDANDRKQAVHISDELGGHPFLKLFREQKVIRLSSPFFFRYWRLDGVDESRGARVVCRFDNGAPAIVEGPRGKGRVVVFASTADDAWNDMPTWPAYLALMQEVMSQIARDPGVSRNVVVGEPLVCSVAPEQFGKPIYIQRPGETRPVAVQPTSSGGLLSLVYEHTDRAGIYEVSFTAGGAPEGDERARRRDLFAVNVPARESDVRRTSEAELRKLLPGVEFDYHRGGLQAAAKRSGGEQGELWRTLAYILLGLIVLESILAQRASR